MGSAADQHVIEMIDISGDVPRVAKPTGSARHGSQDIPLLDVPVMPCSPSSPSLYMKLSSDLLPQAVHCASLRVCVPQCLTKHELQLSASDGSLGLHVQETTGGCERLCFVPVSG